MDGLMDLKIELPYNKSSSHKESIPEQEMDNKENSGLSQRRKSCDYVFDELCKGQGQTMKTFGDSTLKIKNINNREKVKTDAEILETALRWRERGPHFALSNFSINLIPNESVLNAGMTLGQQLLEILKTNSKYNLRIDRVFCPGIEAKHTSILSTDVELFVFIRDFPYPYQHVLDDFKKVLTLRQKELKITSKIKLTQYSVQFTTEDRFEIDVIPTSDFIKSKLDLGLANGVAELVNAELQHIIENHKNGKKFGNLTKLHNFYEMITNFSMSELYLDFLNDHNRFVHQLIRVAKFWYKSLYFGHEEYISGGKRIMELIAITAAENEVIEETEDKPRSLFNALLIFLDLVSRLDRLKIDFGETYAEVEIPPRARAIIDEIQSRPFYIMEPGNPCNDVTKPLTFQIVKELKGFARETLKRFEDVESRIFKGGDENPTIAFEELFRPLPTFLMDNHPSTFKKTAPSEFKCSLITNYISPNPSMIIRKKKTEMESLGNAIMNYLLTMVHATAASNRYVFGQTVRNQVERMVDEDIKGIPHEPWKGSAMIHDNHDCTFIVPFSTKKIREGFAIKLSMNWE